MQIEIEKKRFFFCLKIFAFIMIASRFPTIVDFLSKALFCNVRESCSSRLHLIGLQNPRSTTTQNHSIREQNRPRCMGWASVGSTKPTQCVGGRGAGRGATRRKKNEKKIK